jgi:cyclase
MERGMHISKPLLLLIALGFAPQASAITGDQAEFKKVGENVYAFIGRRNDANALVVVTSQGVVLVDTGNDPPQTRILQNFIKSVTNQPVRYVIITQNHADHIGGTGLFTPPANVIVHDRVASEWASWKPYQIKSWRKRFPERVEALKDINPTDTVISFKDRMTLNLGGTAIELLYVDDPYNPGDIAVWLPQSGVLHAGFAGYIDRHPDMRPDYSHGTTWGMLKQLEVFSALKPKVMVPAHGPLGDVKDLHALTEYLLLARQKVAAMIAKNLKREEIERQFNMDEYKTWDRGLHLESMAAQIYRELKSEGPEIIPFTERTARVTISGITDAGLFLKVTTEEHKELRLRAPVWVNFEGVADRAQLKVGMKLLVQYLEPKTGKSPLGFDITELVVQ